MKNRFFRIPATLQEIGENRENRKESIPPGSSGIAGNRKKSERIGKNQNTELIQSDSQNRKKSERIGKNRFRRGAAQLPEIGKNQLITCEPQAPEIRKNRFRQHPELLKMRANQQESARDQQMCKKPLAPG